MKRVFLAVDLSNEAMAAAKARIEELRSRFPRIRASWVRAENLHVTIKFYGEIEEARIPALSDAARDACRATAPFGIAVGQPGNFGGKVLHMAIDDTDGRLAELHRRVETASEAAGFSKEGRSFRPHLTLARIRAEKGVRPLIDAHRSMAAEVIGFNVAEAVLYESRLMPGGAAYVPLERFPFGTE